MKNKKSKGVVDIPIGEELEWKGRKFVACKDIDGCQGCYFENSTVDHCPSREKVSCSYLNRKDNSDIIWKLKEEDPVNELISRVSDVTKIREQQEKCNEMLSEINKIIALINSLPQGKQLDICAFLTQYFQAYHTCAGCIEKLKKVFDESGTVKSN